MAEHGEARVPDGHCTADGFRLGTWIGGQRSQFKKGELSPVRIVLLEEFDGWGWDARALKRESLYEALLAYVAEFGSSRVPREYRTADGYRLGQWVVNRRVDHKKGKLTPDRIAQLEAVDGWAWKVS